jgi:integrase
MVDATNAGLIGARDRALILLGFAGAFRRSELVALDVEDCSFGKDGLTVLLRRSKTDQEGDGRKIGIPYGSNPDTCPVRNAQEWIAQAAITRGPLFRSINRHVHVQAAESMLRGSSRSWRNVLGWMLRSTRGFPSAMAMLRVPRLLARRSRASWPRRATDQRRWCAVTSAMALFGENSPRL